MKRKTISSLISIVIIGLIVAVGVVAYLFSQDESPFGSAASPTPEPPTLEIGGLVLTPPTSLADISADVQADYPELARLLENPELASVYKDFYITYQSGGQEAALAMARQRGLLNENEDVVMTLVLDSGDAGPALITELEAEGVTVESSYQELINIIIPTNLILEQLEAQEPDLIIARISNLDHVIALRLPERLFPEEEGFLGQGVEVTMANRWHQTGITGQGVKVGVLDLGFARYEALLGTELPENVVVGAFGNTAYLATQVHGTACAEIIHEMAPDAEIYLAYYDGTVPAMGQAVDWLLSQDVDIISNSTSISGLTPMDGSGIVADLAEKTHNAGRFWVNAAGNRADEHYRGTFTDTDGDTLHEFAPGVMGLPFTMKAGTATNLILSWNDWAAIDQDYDLILFDQSGNLLAKAEDFQSAQPGQRPAEVIVYRFTTAGTYLLAIQNRNGQARGDATLDLFVYNGQIPVELRVATASLGTPADARGSFTIGAVHWSNDQLEPYSSQGPTADGRVKPDLVGPSAVKNASYAPGIFDGTSAATPHVAAATALILQAFPDYAPADIVTLLQSRAVKLGDGTFDNRFGAGRLNLGSSPEAGQ